MLDQMWRYYDVSVYAKTQYPHTTSSLSLSTVDLRLYSTNLPVAQFNCPFKRKYTPSVYSNKFEIFSRTSFTYNFKRNKKETIADENYTFLLRDDERFQVFLSYFYYLGKKGFIF